MFYLTISGSIFTDDIDEDDEDDGLEDEDVDELEEEFGDYPPDLIHQNHLNTRVIQTVPAKEPSLSAIPLKSALKKVRGSSPVVVQVPDRASTSAASNNPSQQSSASSSNRDKNSDGSEQRSGRWERLNLISFRP